MICYYTRVGINDDFNEEILIDMFLQWLNLKTKNRMEGLVYNHESSFCYSIDQKTLKIEDFKDNNTLGIQFTMLDHYRKSGFGVEVIYSYEDKFIDLGFYKETNEDSTYIETISIPKIFKDILLSSYIKEDHGLMIQQQPYYIGKKEYRDIKSQNHHLPIVVLDRNKRCCVNPVKLNNEIFGIGYVLCVHTKSQNLKAKIIYPDGFIEVIDQQNEYQMIKEISEKIRIYMIQENNQYYSFDELMKLQLHKEHDTKKEENKEYKTYFLEELNELQEVIKELKIEYVNKKDKYLKLKEESEIIEEKLSLDSHKAILVLKDKNYEEYRQIVLNVLNKKVNELPLEDNFRKRDVIKSILRSQK